MSEPRSFELGFWECRGIQSQEDVVDIGRLLHDSGLLPARVVRANGPYPQVVDGPDIEQFFASIRSDMAARYPQWKPRRLSVTTQWVFPLVQLMTPRAATITVQILHSGVSLIRIIVGTLPSEREGLSLEDFSERWGALLTGAGSTIYERARPGCAAITTFDAMNDSEWIDFIRTVDQRRLIVGWRTWFGPAYVQAFGEDWLLQLPDRTAKLDGGGVFHRLDAPAAAMVQGDPTAYAAVRAFLKRHNVRPAWPLPERIRRQSQRRVQPELP